MGFAKGIDINYCKSLCRNILETACHASSSTMPIHCDQQDLIWNLTKSPGQYWTLYVYQFKSPGQYWILFAYRPSVQRSLKGRKSGYHNYRLRSLVPRLSWSMLSFLIRGGSRGMSPSSCICPCSSFRNASRCPMRSVSEGTW